MAVYQTWEAQNTERNMSPLKKEPYKIHELQYICKDAPAP